jgi:hypothetical protein
MKKVCEHIPGYSYAEVDVPPSPVSMRELDDLKATVGFTDEDARYLRLAGEVLADQAKDLAEHWRGIIAGIPNLARHSRDREGRAIPEYSSNSSLRLQQWVLDTCLRPYDEDWLKYQMEIAARHTTTKKNKVDGVQSTPFVPLRDVIGFVAVMNETIKPYLAAKSHPADEVERMHRAWCKSLQLQVALWARCYGPKEW